MRLFAAVLPPPAALHELQDVVASVGGPAEELDLVPFDRLRIPVTGFGNVAQRDAETLLTALRTAAASWQPAEIRFSGGAALEFPGDVSVWAKIDGDVDGLSTVGKGVPQAVQRVGFLVDRRQFRPWLAIGDITDLTTAPYLERLMSALDDFKGAPWRVSALTVMRKVPNESGVADESVHEEIPLGQ